MGSCKCIICGAPSDYNWFCPYHTEVKEAAYAEARQLGLKTLAEVIALRDKRLSEHSLPPKNEPHSM